MPIKRVEQTLTLAIRVPRRLHDKLDEVRELAKQNGAVYDPVPVLVKALEKDLESARRQLLAAARAPLVFDKDSLPDLTLGGESELPRGQEA